MKLKIFYNHTFQATGENWEKQYQSDFNSWLSDLKWKDKKSIEIVRTDVHIENTKNKNGSDYKAIRNFIYYNEIPIIP